MHAKIMSCGFLALMLALSVSQASAGIGDNIRSSFSELGNEIAAVYDKAASGTGEALQATSAPLLLASPHRACNQC